jgi:hypothetical protein
VLRLCASAILSVLLFCTLAPAQEPPTADQYFSGVVISYHADKVTVERTILGASSTSRSFAITKETQIDGKLRPKVRVTVQFVTKDDVDRAVHIIVRNDSPKK